LTEAGVVNEKVYCDSVFLGEVEDFLRGGWSGEIRFEDFGLDLEFGAET